MSADLHYLEQSQFVQKLYHVGAVQSVLAITTSRLLYRLCPPASKVMLQTVYGQVEGYRLIGQPGIRQGSLGVNCVTRTLSSFLLPQLKVFPNLLCSS